MNISRKKCSPSHLQGVVCAFFLFVYPFYAWSDSLTLFSLIDGMAKNKDHNTTLKYTKTTNKEFLNSTSTAQWKRDENFEFITNYEKKKSSILTGANSVDSAIYGNLKGTIFNNFLKYQANVKTGDYNRTLNDYSRHQPIFDSENDNQNLNSQDFRHTSINTRISSETPFINYGVDFSRIGGQYMPIGDKKVDRINFDEDRGGRSSLEYWVSQSFYGVNLKASYSSLWNNLNKDPEYSRRTDDLFGITASYSFNTLPLTPAISLSYKSGSRKSSLEPVGEKHYDGNLNIISADLSFSINSLSLSLGSSIENSQNDLITSDNSKIISYYFSGSYNLFKELYITPSFSLSDVYLNDASYKFKSVDSSLSLDYISTKSPYSVSIYVYHSKFGDDQYVDSDSFGTGFKLDWRFRFGQKADQKLTFRIEHNSYLDHLYSDSSITDVFVGIEWHLISFW